VKCSWPKLRKRRKLSHCDSYPIRDSNSVRTKYELGVQIIRRRCSVPNMNCTLELAAALLLSQAFCLKYELYFGTRCCTFVISVGKCRLPSCFLVFHFVEFGQQQLLLGNPCAASVPLCKMSTCQSSCDEACSPISQPFPGSQHLLCE